MAAQPPPNSTSALPDENRLDSWKEIAAYLKREVRTVQRWEAREGLPIHRHLHRSQASVFAYKSELDSWWRNYSSAIRVDEDAAGPAAGEASSATQPVGEVAVGDSPAGTVDKTLRQEQSRKLLRLPEWIPGKIPTPVWVAFVVLMGGLACTLVWGLGRHAGKLPVASVYLSGNQLVALDSSGTKVWSYAYSHLPGSSHLYPPTPEVTCHNHEADVLVSVGGKENESDELDCFSNTGTLMWSFALRDTFTFGSQTFGPPWQVADLNVLRVDGQGRVAVALHHAIWWPSMVVLLDTQGRAVGTFVNSGWITSLKAVEESSGMLLLAGGTSNSRDGAMFAVLDPAKLTGSSPEQAGTVYECKSCGLGHPLKYFVFPRSEVNIAAGAEVNFASFDHSNEMIFCRTQEGRGTGRYDSAEGIFTFSPEIDFVHAAYADRYWEAHRQLEAIGAIKHSVNQCPDRFGPRQILSWDPQNGWAEIHAPTIQH